MSHIEIRSAKLDGEPGWYAYVRNGSPLTIDGSSERVQVFRELEGGVCEFRLVDFDRVEVFRVTLQAPYISPTPGPHRAQGGK